MSESSTIEGNMEKRSYKFTHKLKLYNIPFRQAMEQMNKQFLSKFPNGENIAISVWTTPKRTKTPPWPRVYETLSYSGKKITIIPVQASYGLYGDHNIIQPSTISWITAMADIYVIIGVYTNASKKAKGAPSANTNPHKQSTQGKAVFTNFKFDLDDIENQITEIIEKNPKVNDWNLLQIRKIPKLLSESIEHNKRFGIKLGVKVQNFSRAEKRLVAWKKNHDEFLAEFDERSVDAQNREYNSSQKLENVPGNKGKVEINVQHFPKLHLTADSMEVHENEKIITLLEGKNSTKETFPSNEMVLEQLVKFMVFKNCDFQINEDVYQKRLICYVTGTGKPSTVEIKAKYQDIIDECNTNGIEFRFNKKNIK